MTHRFEVGYKERLEQRRKAKNIHRLPQLDYAPYRVYEIKQPKKELTYHWHSIGTGKSSYTMNIAKSRQSSKTNWQQTLWDYINNDLDLINPPQYEVRWLKSKQATILRLKGHRVEKTTPGDQPTVGPVRLGA